MNRWFSFIFSLLLVISAGVAPVVFAQTTPASFAVCTDLVSSGDGDWSHADAGEHNVPGQSSPVRGAQDVYYEGQGNFVQCVCPEQGTGYQMWWWNVSDVTESGVNQFIEQGWLAAAGRDFGLMDYDYLVKVNDYSCNTAANPTVSPTPGVSLTPSPTVSPEVSQIPLSPTPSVSVAACQDTKPNAPTILSITKSGTSSAELVWSEPSGLVDNYSIRYGTDTHKQVGSVEKTGKMTSYRVTGLDFDRSYAFQVRATNGCAVSAWSTEFKFPNGIGKGEQAQGLADTASAGQIVGMIFAGIIGIGAVTLGMKQASIKQRIIR